MLNNKVVQGMIVVVRPKPTIIFGIITLLKAIFKFKPENIKQPIEKAIRPITVCVLSPRAFNDAVVKITAKTDPTPIGPAARPLKNESYPRRFCKNCGRIAIVP